MTSTISCLLEGFSERSVAAKHQLRTFATREPAAFRAEALPIVKSDADEVARRYLMHLLVEHAELADYVSDEAQCTTDEAMILAKIGQSLGVPLQPALEAILGKAVQDSGAGPQIIRIIELFSAVGIRKLTHRLQKDLTAHTDPRVCSKAMSEIVRGEKGPVLAAQALLHSDPRVQANAVEALWHVTDQNVKPVLMLAAKSPHNRVAANGLLGLYLQGVVDSIPLLLGMAGHSDPLHQVSAIWAMGETGDPRFLPFLNREFQKTEGKVKQAIIRALSQIRRQHRESAPTSNGV